MNSNSFSQTKKIDWKSMTGLLVIFLLPSLAGAQVLINCLVAKVDEAPVSLYDLKVVSLFGLEPRLAQTEFPLGKEDLINIYIDELLVLNLTREQISLSREEIDQEIDRVKIRLGSEAFEEKCQALGLEVEDLFPYIENKLLFEKIINSRFSQKVHISLQELEDYYHHTYVPEAIAKGQEVPEMISVITEIENKLQMIKAREELTQWMKELRQKARVIINRDCLEKVEIKEER
ncbi:MAG: hypothetical protein PHU81_04625 [Acidobacteriota bacterium]|nr:hypothetical protein [Acidobacteriota bacterium]